MGANDILKLLLLLLLSLAAAATPAEVRDKRAESDRFRRSRYSSKPYAAGCQPGTSYWHTGLQECAPCSRCAPGDVVFRPCELDHDVQCGPISDLALDYWPWLKERRAKIEENFEELVAGEVAAPVRMQDSVASAHWQWDWQAQALLIAIVICALFFAVAAGYSLHHARHWRLLEEHYEADVEEISSRLALMAAANDASLANCLHPNGRVAMPSNVETGQDVHCANLEQLLAGKSSSKHPGRINIYIEDNET